MMISILIPCYNNSKWIGAAIDSALGQSFAEKEVVVLDDGSTDESLAIIKSYGDKIRWKSIPNGGGNPARNVLLSMARGEWVQFLDGDDYLLPGKVEKQAQMIKSDIDAVYGSVTLEWWNDNGVDNKLVSSPSRDHDIYAHWLNWQLAQTGAVLWRAESIRRIRGWNEAFPCCQDNEICLRALQSGLQFALSADADTVYRLWSSDTVSRRNTSRLIRIKTQLMDDMLVWLSDKKLLTDEHTSIASNVFFKLARNLAAIDLHEGFDYARERRAAGRFSCNRQDVNSVYYIINSIFGFAAAEKAARLFRQSDKG